MITVGIHITLPMETYNLAFRQLSEEAEHLGPKFEREICLAVTDAVLSGAAQATIGWRPDEDVEIGLIDIMIIYPAGAHPAISQGEIRKRLGSQLAKVFNLREVVVNFQFFNSYS